LPGKNLQLAVGSHPSRRASSLYSWPGKTAAPRMLGPSSRVFILGFLVSAWLSFTLLATGLLPLAAASFFAPLIFAVAVFRPAILDPKGPRIYLISCMAAGELLWIWMMVENFVRFEF
jgi:hypothetical protein